MDTSGLSNPLQDMPEDIHLTLWKQVMEIIAAGHLAVTKEIYEDELVNIQGLLGKCIKDNEATLVLEVGQAGWDLVAYIGHIKKIQVDHAVFISENNGGSKATVCLNDLSIIALAKTLKLPVVSMEKAKAHQTDKKRQIPDVCALEKVPHMTFNDFLRAEGIRP